MYFWTVKADQRSPALQQSEGRECTGGFTSCQILWLSRLHLICTALILEFKQNSSQVAGYLEYHLFSKSWTTGVLGVQFAENRGGVDWVVLLWLTRDHLSIGARMKTLFARWGLQKHLQRHLQRRFQNICKDNYKEDCKKKDANGLLTCLRHSSSSSVHSPPSPPPPPPAASCFPGGDCVNSKPLGNSL